MCFILALNKKWILGFCCFKNFATRDDQVPSSLAVKKEKRLPRKVEKVSIWSSCAHEENIGRTRNMPECIMTPHAHYNLRLSAHLTSVQLRAPLTTPIVCLNGFTL